MSVVGLYAKDIFNCNRVICQLSTKDVISLWRGSDWSIRIWYSSITIHGSKRYIKKRLDRQVQQYYDTRLQEIHQETFRQASLITVIVCGGAYSNLLFSAMFTV